MAMNTRIIAGAILGA